MHGHAKIVGGNIVPTALIFGASRGIGRGMAQELLQRGWDVVATVRKRDALGELGSPRLSVEVVDTTDWAGIDALKERLSGQLFDLLFLNAAVAGPAQDPIGEVQAVGFGEMMVVNVLAPLRIVERFIDLVTPTGTAAVMSSSLASVTLNGGGTWEAYRTSKAALNMGLSSIATRRNDDRSYLCVDPGWVRTDMGGPDATLSVEESASGIVTALESRAGRKGLAFVDYKNEELPW
jgi:NAD(P)-dependent dehydrogenase (short-subunit alcohol dehydrogenase family)